MRFFFVRENQQEEVEDMRRLMKLREGRRVLRRLLHMSGAMEQMPSPQNFGCMLARDIEIAVPGALADLLRESSDSRLAENARPKQKKEQGYDG